MYKGLEHITRSPWRTMDHGKLPLKCLMVCILAGLQDEQDGAGVGRVLD